MINRFQLNRAFLALALAALASLVPVAGSADALPSGEHLLGNVAIEPAYDDFNGSIVYLLTPNRLAPLGANNPINNVNTHAVAPLYLIVYPPMLREMARKWRAVSGSASLPGAPT